MARSARFGAFVLVWCAVLAVDAVAGPPMVPKQPTTISQSAILYSDLDSMAQADPALLEHQMDAEHLKTFEKAYRFQVVEGGRAPSFAEALQVAEMYTAVYFEEVEGVLTSAPGECRGVGWSLYYGGGDAGEAAGTEVKRLWKQARYRVRCTCAGSGEERNLSINFRTERSLDAKCPQ